MFVKKAVLKILKNCQETSIISHLISYACFQIYVSVYAFIFLGFSLKFLWEIFEINKKSLNHV